MSTSIVTPSFQNGTWNPTTSTWVTTTLGTVDTTTEVWGTFNTLALAPYQVSALDVRFSSFTLGHYIFDILVYKPPRITNFSSSSGPTITELYEYSAEVDNVVGFVDFTVPLTATEGVALASIAALKRGGPADSNGRVRFSIGLRINPDSTVLSAPLSLIGTLTATCNPAFTGLSGPVQARGRADECPKCGGKSTRDTWVRDGYTKLMVCPECYDDEDRVGQHYQGLGSERPGHGED